MEYIIRPRQGGKTHELVTRLLNEPQGVMLVATEEERRRILSQWPTLKPEQVIGIGQREKLRGRSRGFNPAPSFYVDNADWVLAYLLGETPTAISLTGVNG